MLICRWRTHALRFRLVYLMRRFLFLTLFTALLIPTVAKAERDDVRHICASMHVGEITHKQGLRKLGLSVPREVDNSRRKLVSYCKVYLGYPV